MKLPSKTIERKLFRNGFQRVIGVDEVGMGCLAGPVVVCAVLFTKRFYARSHRRLHWLRDSKLLTARQRTQFAHELLATPGLSYRLAWSFPRTIDRLNIYQAARAAMRRAVEKLIASSSQLLARNKKKSLTADSYKLKAIVLVDGKTSIDRLAIEQLPVVGGDRKVFAIACASIIAKVFRDRMMARYAKRFPGYGLEQHKGYGTALHRTRLAALGPSPIHRKSFAPVADLL